MTISISLIFTSKHDFAQRLEISSAPEPDTVDISAKWAPKLVNDFVSMLASWLSRFRYVDHQDGQDAETPRTVS